MFEHFRAKRAQKRYQAELANSQKRYEAELADWQKLHDAVTELLQLAQEFNGLETSEILLGQGEALFYEVSDVALIEERVTGGHYEGRSSGVSLPIGSLGGRSVRYRVGATRGHYVKGTPTPTALDTGTVFITNKRVIFQGPRQTREWSFAKLIGIQHDDAAGSTTLSVSNRQKPTTIVYGPSLSAVFVFRLELAIAHFRGTVANVVAEVQKGLEQIDGERPAGPAVLPTSGGLPRA